MTPAGTSNELDVQNKWEENTHTHTHHRVNLSPVIFFLLHNLSSLPLLVSLLFLSLHKLYTPSVPESTTTLVTIPVVPMSHDGSAKSDLPAGGQEELGGISHSLRTWWLR